MVLGQSTKTSKSSGVDELQVFSNTEIMAQTEKNQIATFLYVIFSVFYYIFLKKMDIGLNNYETFSVLYYSVLKNLQLVYKYVFIVGILMGRQVRL